MLAEGNHDEEFAEGSDDEEEDEEFLTRQAELEEMDRARLKAELKKVDPGFRVFKSHSDDDLRDAILDAEFPPEPGGR